MQTVQELLGCTYVRTLMICAHLLKEGGYGECEVRSMGFDPAYSDCMNRDGGLARNRNGSVRLGLWIRTRRHGDS